MRFVVGAVLRSISLLLSYALSTLSAASFLTFVLFLGSEIGWLVDDPLVIGGAALYLFTTWLITAQLVFAPALVAIVTAELARLSSLLSNVLLGGVCAVVVIVLSPLQNVVTEGSYYQDGQFELAVISAGFIAGFTHWVFVGHRAGRWLHGSSNPGEAHSEQP